MRAIIVAGGVYHERCIWPDWDQLFGSGGRAASALARHAASIRLRTYARSDTADAFRANADAHGFVLDPVEAPQTISFEYVHSLSVPVIRPSPSQIRQQQPFSVGADAVLRFGMMEGSAVVDAEWCVYDPQSAFNPEMFIANGSVAKHLAIVANRGEVLAMTNAADAIVGAQTLVRDGADLVVIKSGTAGADVVHASNITHVPAFQTDTVWTIGSGDVFAAIFAARWAVHGETPEEAARTASKAVATYAESMALPAPDHKTLRDKIRTEARAAPRSIYLAAPFFTLGQRWVVDEARRCLRELGLFVFSPAHDVGPGPAEQVAPADLGALSQCDAVFAILDGTDSGTLFELGHARAIGKPVYALAQTVSEEDLKIVAGSGCRVYDDFVTALHHVAWGM